MGELINIREYPARDVLDLLLKDKTTGKNIIWATDAYEGCGAEYTDKNQILEASLVNEDIKIKPRIIKTQEEQELRTRKKAEVMTPVWLCNQMNNYLDEEWFGKKGIFNKENKDHTWTVNKNKVPFEDDKGWKRYVDSRRLEITCGEAPYLVSRYDTTTGELIAKTSVRIGLLDRKMRVVNENVKDKDEWIKWAERAFQSCYGYEYQGDNLLIARNNVLLTYTEYYKDRWGSAPDTKLLKKIANIISWNLWQMDGLKDCVPLGKPVEEYEQNDLFSMFPEAMGVERTALDTTERALPCKIYNWRTNESKLFRDYKES